MKRIYIFIFTPFFIIACSKSIIKEQPTPSPQAKIETTILKPTDLKTLSKTVKPSRKNTSLAKKTARKTKTQPAKKKKIKIKSVQKSAISTTKNTQTTGTDTLQIKLAALKASTKHTEQTTETESMAIRENKLPVQFGSSWILDKKPGYLSNKSQCLLTSVQKRFYDGYDNAKMSLQLSATALIIKTDSEIDLTYPEVGIYIDNNSVFLFDKVANKRYTLNRKNISELTALMKTGKKINIKLGFWPTWPQTKTSSVIFSLQSFGKALAALKACNQL